MRDANPLWLGTALWGWGIERDTAHALLDMLAQHGGGIVDAAVNYPINKRPEDFGRANAILSDWLQANRGSGIKVFCKIGALDNSGGPEANLERSAILTTTELLRGKFFDDLWGVGVHWDNREKPDEIAGTIEGMRELRDNGLRIGFSGVKRPDIYAKLAPALAGQWLIQVKENASTTAARQSYAPHFPEARYIAYGINMGGVKSDVGKRNDSSLAMRGLSEPEIVDRLRAFVASAQDIEPRPSSLNELALLMAFAKEELGGIIAGPRTPEQFGETLRYHDRLVASDVDKLTRAKLAALWAGQHA